MKNIIESIDTSWSESEWGFPKGRKDKKEKDKNAAIREFREETQFKKEDYNLLNISPLEEKSIGTDNISYERHYYVAQIKNNKSIKLKK